MNLFLPWRCIATSWHYESLRHNPAILQDKRSRASHRTGKRNWLSRETPPCRLVSSNTVRRTIAMAFRCPSSGHASLVVCTASVHPSFICPSLNPVHSSRYLPKARCSTPCVPCPWGLQGSGLRVEGLEAGHPSTIL